MKGEEGRKEGRKGREMMLKTGEFGKIQSKKGGDKQMTRTCRPDEWT